MAFETLFLSDKEAENVREKYNLNHRPFPFYRYDKVNNVYLYILSFGCDLDHPGHFVLIWDDLVCKMSAHPTEWFNLTSTKPEKTFLIRSIHVPENFNKDDRDVIIDLLELAFTCFVVQIEGKILYYFNISINREKLIKNFYINYRPID